MLDYVTLRKLGTVRPIFPKIASKVAQGSKEKSRESAVREKKFAAELSRETSGGGGESTPPVWLGLSSAVSDTIHVNHYTVGYINIIL